MSFTLAGRRILVPGGARGIGEYIVKAAAAQGASTIVFGYVSSKEAADKLIATIKDDKATSKCNVVAIQGSIVDQKSAQAFVKESLTKVEGGKFDSLVYSAGIMKMVPLSDATEESYDFHFNTNVKAPLFTIQALLPNLANDGQIVLFSTSLTTHPMAIQPGYLQYNMTKGAIEQMTRVLARDPSIGGPDRRITVNAIAPGATGTELFFQGKSEEMINRIAGLMPQQRLGKPEEVAEATISLLMPSSKWITGQTIRVNGAQSL